MNYNYCINLIFSFFTFLILYSCSLKSDPNNYIILVIGQSNTHAGIGFDVELDKPVKGIKQLGRFGADNMKIIEAVEPIQHHTKNKTKIGFSFTFAKLLKNHINSDSNIILVPCGFGGTGFKDNRWNKGDDLYNDAIKRVKSTVKNYPGSKLITILWHQGEKDVGSKSYQTDLDNFIVNLRNDLNAKDVPFILGGMVPFWVDKSTQRQQQQNIISSTVNRHIKIGYANPEIPFRIKKNDDEFDAIHYDAYGQRELGKRYFNEFLRLKNQ